MQNKDKPKTMYFDTYVDIANLLNNPRIPCTVYWDPQAYDFICLEEHEEVANYLIEIPSMDELVPYPESVRGFFRYMDLIPNKSPLRFIWDAGLTQTYNDYHMQKAAEAFIKWGHDHGIHIGFSNENPIPIFQPNGSYTFENFTVTDHCKKAYSIVREIAEDKLPAGLYGIQGDWGMGRSHLLHAAIHRFNYLFPTKTTHLMDENTMIWDYKRAKSLKKEAELLNFYCDVDLLALDNLDLILKEEECAALILEIITNRLKNSKQTLYSAAEIPNWLSPDDSLRQNFQIERIFELSSKEKMAIAVEMMHEETSKYNISEEDLESYCQDSNNLRELSGHICKRIFQEKTQNQVSSQKIYEESCEEEIKEKWPEIKELIKKQISSISYETWIAPMMFRYATDCVCCISVPGVHEHMLDYIADMYRYYFEESILELIHRKYTVIFMAISEK